ncbi:hypothetical protein OH76DRAFT_709969 [Lentinus brumalis]|uniref:F-box domain-containing protein n=1 Tax=Lentinus brumalis TaxID=2498619 RepID=A0A371D5B7_9APHY|nr:hypothetical protein OH76DRAFT_709969 [Polyporus brumalis]
MKPWAAFPQEIFNLIVDAVADDVDEDHMLTLETLRSCGVVSKAWRTHVQPYLYRVVVITSVADLHKLLDMLDAYPRIARAVERLLVCVQYRPDARCGLHLDASQSAIGLFPSLIQGRLPKLSTLRIEVLASDVIPRREETLCIPSRFSEHLSRFMSTVTSLHLQNMHLPCFSDYMRMLWALPNITVLYCADLRWSAPGLLPACMRDKDKLRLRRRRKFLPKLKHLTAIQMDVLAMRVFVSALGQSLEHLCIDVTTPAYEIVPQQDLMNLREFTDLTAITLLLEPTRPIQEGHAAIIHEVLRKWMPLANRKDVWVRPLAYTAYCTRETYLNVLRSVAQALEPALLDEAPLDDDDLYDSDSARPVVHVVLPQADVRQEAWWTENIYECFHTFLQIDGIALDFMDGESLF